MEKGDKQTNGNGAQISDESALNHHYDTLKPETVIDVKDLSNDELNSAFMFLRSARTVVITQLTAEKARYLIEHVDDLFANKTITNLYFDPYNTVHGMDASLLYYVKELGDCFKKMKDITNVYFIVRKGTYCSMK